MGEALSLEDERRISATILRYADSIDRRDWTAFRSCFTDDVQAVYHEVGAWQGLDSFAADFEEIHLGFGPSLHRTTNITFDLSGGTTSTRCYVDVVLNRMRPAKGAVHECGFYEDTWVEVDGAWKMSRREYTPVHRF